MKTERIHHHGYQNLKWVKHKDLKFGDVTMASLIPHKYYPKMYHLKFFWRDGKTPEFFNGTWAQENAVQIVLHRLNYDTWQRPLGAPYSDLNEKKVVG